MILPLRKELDGEILDVGGGGEGTIGRLYGSQVTAIDNRQEELDEALDGYKKCSWMGRTCNLTMAHLTT